MLYLVGTGQQKLNSSNYPDLMGLENNNSPDGDWKKS